MNDIPSPRRTTVVAGAILLVATLLAIVAMAHHPTVGRTADIGHAVERIGVISHTSALVHGALIAMMLLTLECLFEFAALRGFARPLVRSGSIAYATGVVVMIGAALVSGFVIADVAATMPHDTAIDLQITHHLLILCGILNQACANCGMVAMSVGIGLWSIDLLRDRGAVRVVGLFGCGVAMVPVVALFLGALRLDVHGMTHVVLAQAAWYLAIATLMIRAGRRPA